MRKPQIAVLLILACSMAVTAQTGAPKKSRSSGNGPGAAKASTSRIKHVLLVSIDGLHALDLATYIANRADSTLAQLGKRGIIYSNASTPIADSTPGLLALVTG